MNYIIDIETAPLAEAELLKYAEEIKADSRLKDPVKIAEDLRAKKEKLISAAPLSALTGKICGFGVMNAFTGEINISAGLEDNYEKQALTEFETLIVPGNTLITFNGGRFDIPYLCRRGLLYGKNLFSKFFKLDGYPLSQVIHIDLAQVWDCRCREYVSLAKLAAFLKVGEKTEEGTFFHESLAANKSREAKAYLENDLKLTLNIAKKFGVV
jgi:predicted PolB exonuclease-like 3'-5' exonuclease